MSTVVVTMILIVALALLVTAVVAIGMRGKLSGAAPAMADRLGTMGLHLNGEAETPESLRQLFHTGQQTVRRVAHRD